MNSVDKAVETQLRNIEKRTGQSLEALTKVVQESGLEKHGEIRQMLIDKFGLGYGDANTLAHYARQAGSGQPAAETDGAAVLDAIYTGAKAPLRPIHERIIEGINRFGEYETAPKKGYVSLRRKKQFAMVGPGTRGRLEVGINAKGLSGPERLVEQPAGGMCNYKVFLTDPSEVDAELIGWLRQAYDSAG